MSVLFEPGIVPRCGLETPEDVIPVGGARFFASFKTALRSHPTSYNVDTESLSQG